MNEGALIGRSISFPPRVVDGRVAWSEGADNVRESIQIILLTDMGERLRLTRFGGGLSQFLFEPNTVATRQLIADRIARVIAQWEPRAVIESVAVDPDPGDAQSAIATVTYKLVATQSREQLQINVALAN